MLIVLVAFAVTFSLAAELAYGYFADRHEVNWVRPELAEHAAIVRAQGRLRGMKAGCARRNGLRI